MNERYLYKVTQLTHYDEVNLDIAVGFFESSEDEIEDLANQKLSTTLKQDGLYITYGNNEFVIYDNEKEKYQFEIYTKTLPPPIDPFTLTEDEIINLLNDERYMATPDDFKKVDWNLSQAYNELKRINPVEEVFQFSSLAYGIEKASNNTTTC